MSSRRTVRMSPAVMEDDRARKRRKQSVSAVGCGCGGRRGAVGGVEGAEGRRARQQLQRAFRRRRALLLPQLTRCAGRKPAERRPRRRPRCGPRAVWRRMELPRKVS